MNLQACLEILWSNGVSLSKGTPVTVTLGLNNQAVQGVLLGVMCDEHGDVYPVVRLGDTVLLEMHHPSRVRALQEGAKDVPG